jgi:UDP-N-acetylglucosamine pyrophosphorylase
LSDVVPEDVIFIDEDCISKDTHARGLEALTSGSVGVVTLAAGVGSRWTQGAGVVKALHPFCCISGKHRCFLDVHLAKNRRVSAEVGMPIPHVITTSWMTDAAIAGHLESRNGGYGDTPIYVSKGQTVGLRMIPTELDLKFLWNEQSHQRLDEQAEKVRESVQSALINWAKSCGEGSDYRDNSPGQCLSPVGHWYEFPNLLLNGTLAKMLRDRPQLKTLMLHNIDTIGVDVDANILGKFLESESTLVYEVVPRRIEDTGGGLCRVNGKPRLVEGLALPSATDELKFS